MSIHYDSLKVIENTAVTKEIHKLTLRTDIKIDPYPGQFIMIDTVKNRNGNYNCLGPILKRPFSFYKLIDDNTFEIVFRINGRGTELLSKVEPEDELKFLGPLGNPIPLIDIYMKYYPNGISLVGGGMGIVPLVFLAQGLNTIKYRRVGAYIGFKTSNEFSQMIVRDLHKLIHWSNIFPAYEDLESESAGFEIRGTAIDSFNHYDGSTDTTIFVCGQEQMMEHFHNHYRYSNFPCYCFVERHMACGIGVCHGCNINGKTVCKDGPCLESKYVFKRRIP